MRLYTYLIEVLPAPGVKHQWFIITHQNSGDTEHYGTYRTKVTAVRKARALARRTAEFQGTNLRLELQIKGRDERIQRKDSYGTDPRSIKG